jgi:DNA repair exonuclease SbcCD ATPase subunit
MSEKALERLEGEYAQKLTALQKLADDKGGAVTALEEQVSEMRERMAVMESEYGEKEKRFVERVDKAEKERVEVLNEAGRDSEGKLESLQAQVSHLEAQLSRAQETLQIKESVSRDNVGLLDQLQQLRESFVGLSNEKAALVDKLHDETRKVERLTGEVARLQELKVEVVGLRERLWVAERGGGQVGLSGDGTGRGVDGLEGGSDAIMTSHIPEPPSFSSH